MVPFTSNSAVRSFSWAESKLTPSAEAEMVIGLPVSSVPASTSIACNSFTLLLLSLVTTKSAPCGPKLGSTTGVPVLKAALVPKLNCQSLAPVSALNAQALVAPVLSIGEVTTKRTLAGKPDTFTPPRISACPITGLSSDIVKSLWMVEAGVSWVSLL